MDAGAIEQALGLVAALTEPGGVLEDRLVPVCRGPDERDPLACLDLAAPDGHRPGRDSPVGDQRSVEAEDLLDGVW